MLPLAGVRILAVEQYGAGPFGSMHSLTWAPR
jgi:crotonobetainyl-CoA:carnitine CoA-transferase CaiB-like acyl-CoA transferase